MPSWMWLASRQVILRLRLAVPHRGPALQCVPQAATYPAPPSSTLRAERLARWLARLPSRQATRRTQACIRASELDSTALQVNLDDPAWSAIDAAQPSHLLHLDRVQPGDTGLKVLPQPNCKILARRVAETV